MTTDQRGYLDTEPFEYQRGKDGRIFLFWEGRRVKVLKGKEAEKFSNKIGALDAKGAQVLMAKLTGNFKRGNERL